MKYIIGIDLDGTLLNEEKVISAYNKSILKQLQNEGHKIVIATGRSYVGAIEYHKELGLDTPLVTLNGAVTFHLDGNKDAVLMNNDLVRKMYGDLKHLFISVLVNGIDKVYGENTNLELEKLFNGANCDKMYDLDINKIDEIVNMIVIINEENRMIFENYFSDLSIKPRFWLTNNGISFYDLHVRSVSKASALQNLLNHYSLTEEHLITLGDAANDLEMIKLAKNGVAMKNGIAALKNEAKHITDNDNENDGVGLFLEKFIL